MQKLRHKFLGLATSGRHNFAMITDLLKLTTKIALYGMSSFHFYLWNQFKIIPQGFMPRTRNVLPTFSATSDVWYWANHVRRCSCLAADMQEKQTELETENK